MQAVINTAYPARLQLQLGSITGPLSSTVLGAFDPRRDLEVYADGVPVTLISFSFDGVNNRYLMFASSQINTASVVQVIHHVPNPPFMGSASLPGFALVASLSTALDTPPISLGLTTSTITANQPYYLTWSAVSVPQIEITTSTGYSSGLISATSTAGVAYPPNITTSGTYTATIEAYDANGNALLQGGSTVTYTINLTVH